jgi:hypothetical protein
MITFSIVVAVLAIGCGIRKLVLMIDASLRKAIDVQPSEQASAAR